MPPKLHTAARDGWGHMYTVGYSWRRYVSKKNTIAVLPFLDYIFVGQTVAELLAAYFTMCRCAETSTPWQPVLAPQVYALRAPTAFG